MTGPDSTSSFDIDGRTLRYPTMFRDGHSAAGLFLVPIDRAAERLASTPFSPAMVLPGRGVCSLVCVHYTDTDCGVYHEIAVSLFVDPPDRRGGALGLPRTWRDVLSGQIATHTVLLPVTTELARDAGIQMWGFPKHLADLESERQPESIAFTWREGDQTVLRYSVPTSGDDEPDEISPPVYSLIDGQVHVSRLTQRYTGVGRRFRGGNLELGTHPIADDLRRLGVGRTPMLSIWNEHLEFEMSAPERC